MSSTDVSQYGRIYRADMKKRKTPRYGTLRYWRLRCTRAERKLREVKWLRY